MIKKLTVENLFGLWITTADGVANNHDLGLGRDVLTLVSLKELNALPLKKSGHGRVDVGVRARDLEARSLHCCSD